MQSIQSISVRSPSRNVAAIGAKGQSAIKDCDNIQRLGYDMGIFAATYWPVLKDSKRFRHMTIVDYRETGAADAAKSLADQNHSYDFINGFRMGFEDEAFDRAEAGMVGFEDVREAGSVDESVAVLARRLLRATIGSADSATN